MLLPGITKIRNLKINASWYKNNSAELPVSKHQTF
jgi:hypothetical protein